MCFVSSSVIVKSLLRDTATGWGVADAIRKVSSHGERLALFLQGLENEIVPANAEIWPSLSCNARCVNCPYARNQARHDADRPGAPSFQMSLALWKELAPQLSHAGILSVTFTGGGEPTLHPSIGEFGSIARENGLAWGLFTNGYELNPSTAIAVLQGAPEFVRVSVNSWSSASHERLYHLGSDAYERILSNTIDLARRAPQSTAVGLGYVLDHATAEQARGIAEYVKRIARTAGRLDYVAFRPSVLYYRNGEPVPRQPHPELFAEIGAIVRQELAGVCKDEGVSLQVNDAGFTALAGELPPSGCIATQWATSATETGQLYLMSEANGSPLPRLAELAYGQAGFQASFERCWRGPARRRLSDEFARGERLAPAWHKLIGIDGALRELRAEFGIVSSRTAREVQSALDDLPKVPHWKFI